MNLKDLSEFLYSSSFWTGYTTNVRRMLVDHGNRTLTFEVAGDPDLELARKALDQAQEALKTLVRTQSADDGEKATETLPEMPLLLPVNARELRMLISCVFEQERKSTASRREDFRQLRMKLKELQKQHDPEAEDEDDED